MTTGCDAVFDLEPMTCKDQALGHDEDIDGTVDGCDNCPADANPDQEDIDADGVGDRCDPHRDEPVDSIVFFDPFTTPDPRWVAEGIGPEEWVFEDGAVHQRGTTPRTTLFLGGEVFANASAQIVFAVGPIPTSSAAMVGVYVGAPTRTHTPDGLSCTHHRHDLDGMTPYEDVPSIILRAPTQTPTKSAQIPPGERMMLRVIAGGECVERTDQQPNITLTLDDRLAPIQGGEIGLHVSVTTATFYSVTVYGSTR